MKYIVLGMLVFHLSFFVAASFVTGRDLFGLKWFDFATGILCILIHGFMTTQWDGLRKILMLTDQLKRENEIMDEIVHNSCAKCGEYTVSFRYENAEGLWVAVKRCPKGCPELRHILPPDVSIRISESAQ